MMAGVRVVMVVAMGRGVVEVISLLLVGEVKFVVALAGRGGGGGGRWVWK